MTEKPSNKRRSGSGSYQAKDHKQRTRTARQRAPRTRFVLNRLDAMRVQRLADRLGVPEERVLQLAIQNFAPATTTARTDRPGLRPGADRIVDPEKLIDSGAIAQEAQGMMLATRMELALDNAIKAVDEANESVLQARRDMNDPVRRAVMEAEIRQQFAGEESSVDAQAAAMQNRDTEGGAQ